MEQNNLNSEEAVNSIKIRSWYSFVVALVILALGIYFYVSTHSKAFALYKMKIEDVKIIDWSNHVLYYIATNLITFIFLFFAIKSFLKPNSFTKDGILRQFRNYIFLSIFAYFVCIVCFLFAGYSKSFLVVFQFALIMSYFYYVDKGILNEIKILLKN